MKSRAQRQFLLGAQRNGSDLEREVVADAALMGWPASPLDPSAPLPPIPSADPDTAPIDTGVLYPTQLHATVWPTRGLAVRNRWYDELCVWTEGVQSGTMRRASIQLEGLNMAFAMLEEEKSQDVAVTLSFGTIERCLDPVTQVLESHRLLCHRIAIVVRGQIDRIRSPYRVQSFIGWLRSQQICVGYRLNAARIGMEMKAIGFVQPDFAKVQAPQSRRLEDWQDALLEARAAGLNADWLIVAGIETAEQKYLATAAGYRFGQGTAIKPCHPPTSAHRSTVTWPGACDVDPDTVTGS